MEHYCITGGIGSGKSYVCKVLEDSYGIKVYDCDSGAKKLMNGSDEIKSQLTALIGNDTYKDGRLNRPVVAEFLLRSEANKQAINRIVHPAVMHDFYESGLQWMESAILYEANLEHYVDKVVAVVAPREVRIKRVMQRDGITYAKAAEWVDKQASQEEVEKRADFIVVNDGEKQIEEQIVNIINKLLKDNDAKDNSRH